MSIFTKVEVHSFEPAGRSENDQVLFAWVTVDTYRFWILRSSYSRMICRDVDMNHWYFVHDGKLCENGLDMEVHYMATVPENNYANFYTIYFGRKIKV